MLLPSWYLLVPVLLPALSGLLVGLCRPLGARDRARTALTGAVLVLNALALIPVLLAEELTLQLFRLSDSLRQIQQIDAAGQPVKVVPKRIEGFNEMNGGHGCVASVFIEQIFTQGKQFPCIEMMRFGFSAVPQHYIQASPGGTQECQHPVVIPVIGVP